jgi:D-serine dehydratase
MENATHIVWATGGRLVPEDVRKEYLKTHIKNK